MFLLDTTAMSAAMRYEPEMTAFMKSTGPGNMTTAHPVTAELFYGIERLPAGRKKKSLSTHINTLLTYIKATPWTDEASELFGVIKSRLEQTGRLIDDFDIAIAAIAKSRGYTVVTANLSRFLRVPDLEVHHWSSLTDGSPAVHTDK